jgi:NADPH:quinone reductase-like Zn-dependent oxidoreductase
MLLKRIAFWGGGVIAVAFLALFIAYWMSDNDCDSGPALQGDRMKAVIYCDYGPPDVLRVEDLEKPVPGDGQLLVRVRAAAINPVEWHYMRGEPYIMRLDSGLRKPKITQLGVDFAGTVEAVGDNVKQFKPGDEVFGGRTGALAEYLIVSEDRSVVLKPANLTFEQAASVPIAAITALQGLRDKGKLKPGQKVLINGASGGVGTFAVQIAKAFGAHVTGVCSTHNLEMVRSIGADEVIDYTREDFTEGAQLYDVILDMVGNHPLSAYRRVLEPNGIHVLVGGPDSGNWIGPLMGPIKALISAPFVDKEHAPFLAELNKQDLDVLADLMRAGKVTPVIDRRYSLDRIAEAIAYLEEGHAKGKVVISIE